ncbi:MAG: S1 RNA-binding domain-containing protein [Pirellulales bacterium]
MTDEMPAVDETLAAAAENSAQENGAASAIPPETAPVAATPAENAGSSSPGAPAASEPAGQRIKIGSQRQSGTRFRAEAKPPQRKFRPAAVPPGPMRDLAAKTSPKGNAPPVAGHDAGEGPRAEAASPPSAADGAAADADTSTNSTVGESRERREPREAVEPAPTLARKVAESVVDNFATRERTPLPTDLQDEVDEMLSGVSLDEMIGSTAGPMSAAELEPDSRLRGRVEKIHRDDVFIDLGGRNQGVAALHTFATEPEVGEMLEVVVRRFLADEGLYEVTVPGASVAVQDWSELSEGLVVDAVVTGHNKGGLECEVSRIRGFIPAGQVSNYRVEDLSELVGEKFACVVTEANEDKRNLVLSRRAVLEREAAEAKTKLLAELEVGQTREGIVRRITDFGAFVDIGGVDGLIHISQMSWDRVKHPSEVLADGQKVKVRVEKIDQATGKIGLSYRDTFENPWNKAAEKYPASSIVKGTVSRIMDFGAFVKLEPGIEGLVHISELSYKRVFRTGDVVQEGQEIEVKVLSMDAEAQRISLSMRALEARMETEAEKKAREEDDAAATDGGEPTAELKKSNLPLKGGLASTSEGAKFGLKW